MTLHLTPRQRATLTVALRAWQNELSYHTVNELRDYYPGLWGHQPLSVDEVDGLLAQLRTDGVHEAAAGSVSSSRSAVQA